ncbi:MAG: hypothetical protein Q9168_005674 [Polycauliona sp. 1 TL-2023]
MSSASSASSSSRKSKKSISHVSSPPPSLSSHQNQKEVTETKPTTGNYINGGIWAETEPAVAIICACLPSLRPLFRVAAGFRSRLMSNQKSTDSQKSSKWLLTARSRSNNGISKGGSSNSSSGAFSRMGAFNEEVDMPLGHVVDVCGPGVDGEREGGPSVELPEGGIRVKTVVMLVSSERLDYRDRLF